MQASTKKIRHSPGLKEPAKHDSIHRCFYGRLSMCFVPIYDSLTWGRRCSLVLKRPATSSGAFGAAVQIFLRRLH
jgi:hypothetical protein